MQPSKQLGLTVLLIVQTLAIIGYTVATMYTDGWNFLGAGFEYLQSLQWKGQFTLDFFCYLILSALWIMWRNKFQPLAIFIGIMASIWGILLFAPYLIYLVSKHQGNLRKVVLGMR